MNLSERQEVVRKATHCVNLSVQEIKDILDSCKTDTKEYKNYCEQINLQINDKLNIMKQELEALQINIGYTYEWHFESGVLQIIQLCFSKAEKQKIRDCVSKFSSHHH
jgi:DNA-binding transcriptional MerR regulator